MNSAYFRLVCLETGRRKYLTGSENDARENTFFCLQWKYHMTTVSIKLKYLHPLNQRFQVWKLFPCHFSPGVTGVCLQFGWKLVRMLRGCSRPAGSGLSRAFPALFFPRCCQALARGITGEAQPWICFLLALSQRGGGEGEGECRRAKQQRKAERLLTELHSSFPVSFRFWNGHICRNSTSLCNKWNCSPFTIPQCLEML